MVGVPIAYRDTKIATKVCIVIFLFCVTRSEFVGTFEIWIHLFSFLRIVRVNLWLSVCGPWRSHFWYSWSSRAHNNWTLGFAVVLFMGCCCGVKLKRWEREGEERERVFTGGGGGGGGDTSYSSPFSLFHFFISHNSYVLLLFAFLGDVVAAYSRPINVTAMPVYISIRSPDVHFPIKIVDTPGIVNNQSDPHLHGYVSFAFCSWVVLFGWLDFWWPCLFVPL